MLSSFQILADDAAQRRHRRLIAQTRTSLLKKFRPGPFQINVIRITEPDQLEQCIREIMRETPIFDRQCELPFDAQHIIRESPNADLARLLESSHEARILHDLLQDFLHMLRERGADQLNGWMKEAPESGIRELRSFVAGIERDYDAVRNGLTLEWSQGVVEGTINKLLTHKRLMYGRASFRLLRQKLLHPS